MKRFLEPVKLRPVQWIVLVFLVIILLGACLLNLPAASKDGQSIGFLDALFTSASATCVTGLVVTDTYTHWTLGGQLVILLLIQIGGLGFMSVMTLFSMLLKRTISMQERMLLSETLSSGRLQGVVRLERRILQGTLAAEGIGAVALSFRFVPRFGPWKGLYFSIFHSISAFCNAGFDLMGGEQAYSSLTSFIDDPLVNLTVMALIVAGGLGFVVWSDLFEKRRWSRLSLHTKVVLTVSGSLILFGAVLIFLFESSNPDTLQHAGVGEKIWASLFQSVTARTAGFNTLPISQLKDSSVLIMIFLMFIGGSPGSTAGGVKTTTLGIIIASVLTALRGGRDVNLFQRRISQTVVFKSLVIIMLGLLIVSTGTLIILTVEHVTLSAAAFEAVSAFGTVGVSMGITPELSSVSKIALIFMMYIGRVGVMTTALAIMLRHSGSAAIQYPEGQIMIG
ncbi:MAG: TrkH family potassium uptake protein [Clostridia bacterium]